MNNVNSANVNSANALPVVFVDTRATDPEWFKLARAQAQVFNAQVCWIGNRPHADIPVVFYNNSPDIQEFRKTYQHLSTNPEWFERICIERWFILRNYLASENLSNALYVDSDMLLFCNAQVEYERFWKPYAFTLALGTSPAANFVRLDALQSFCDYVLKLYRDKTSEPFQLFLNIYKQMRKENRAGGICDMTLWKYFAQLSNFPCGELTTVQIDDSTWDHNINAADGYEMRDGIKKIDINITFNKNNTVEVVPVGYNENGRRVAFKALHFQGGAKKLLVNFVRITRDTHKLHMSGRVSTDSFQTFDSFHELADETATDSTVAPASKQDS